MMENKYELTFSINMFFFPSILKMFQFTKQFLGFGFQTTIPPLPGLSLHQKTQDQEKVPNHSSWLIVV